MPRALVTGASRGIGRAIAERLARDGFDVVAAARNRTELDELCAAIVAEGGRCQPLVLDVSDPQAVAACLLDADIDVLVNNAGIGMPTAAVTTPAGGIRSTSGDCGRFRGRCARMRSCFICSSTARRGTRTRTSSRSRTLRGTWRWSRK